MKIWSLKNFDPETKILTLSDDKPKSGAELAKHRRQKHLPNTRQTWNSGT